MVLKQGENFRVFGFRRFVILRSRLLLDHFWFGKSQESLEISESCDGDFARGDSEAVLLVLSFGIRELK